MSDEQVSFRKDQFDPQSGYDPDVRRELLASAKARVVNGHLFQPTTQAINKSYPVRINKGGGASVTVREFNRVYSLIAKLIS